MSGEVILFEPELDEDRIEGLLAEHDGKVGRVAKKLGVKSSRLRKFVAMSPRLSGAIDEVFEGAVDEAVGVLFEGLRDEMSFQNRFYAAKEFLRTGAARRRGFGHEASGSATLELKDKGGARTITLRWLEPREERPEGDRSLTEE
jgi:hypothetical protein